jgi:hypothetical protein
VSDWATIASLATAAGTLVLAVATFAAVRSGNRSARTSELSARTAEQSLLAGQRPLLVTSRLQDPPQKVRFVEGNWLTVQGGGATLEATDGVLYLAMSVRNVGTGLAVMLGWHVLVGRQEERSHPPLEEFTTQQRDIYVAPGDSELWQGALRDPADDRFKAVAAAIEARDILAVDLLYGDFEGGQRMISQFALQYINDRWLALVGRHFNIDRPDPR